MRLADVRVTGLSALLLYVHPSVPSRFLLSLLCLLTYYVCLPIDCALTDRETRHTCFLSIRKFHIEWNPIVEKKKMLLIELRGSQVYRSHEGGIFLSTVKINIIIIRSMLAKIYLWGKTKHECKWDSKSPQLRASNWRQKGSMEASGFHKVENTFRAHSPLSHPERHAVESSNSCYGFLSGSDESYCWWIFIPQHRHKMKTICHMAITTFSFETILNNQDRFSTKVLK